MPRERRHNKQTGKMWIWIQKWMLGAGNGRWEQKTDAKDSGEILERSFTLRQSLAYFLQTLLSRE